MYVVRGPVSGTLNLSLADAKVSGDHAGASMGMVSSAGDVDGDGRPDILIAAPRDNEAGTEYGAAYLFYASDL